MKLYIPLAALTLVFSLGSADISADGVSTLHYCEVSALGRLLSTPSEVSFDGSFTDDGDVFLFDWMHSTLGVLFETDHAESEGHGTNGCRLNGITSAEIQGTGELNGVPGFPYRIRIEDNRPAPERIFVTASITRKPTRRSEGILTFGSPTPVVVPSEIVITTGASGHGWSRLHLDETITCRYRGAGATYDFERCTDPLHMEYVPGSVIDVTSVRLRIQSADNSFDLTSIEADLGTIAPPVSAPDQYYIGIFESAMPGAPLVYEVSGAVSEGDIAITLLGPKPPPPSP